MIEYRTFSKRAGLSSKSIRKAHDEIRTRARTFIREEIPVEQVINISESAVLVPLGMSVTLLSVTVWYRKEGRQ